MQIYHKITTFTIKKQKTFNEDIDKKKTQTKDFTQL